MRPCNTVDLKYEGKASTDNKPLYSSNSIWIQGNVPNFPMYFSKSHDYNLTFVDFFPNFSMKFQKEIMRFPNFSMKFPIF